MCQRRDALHKFTTQLTRENQVLAVESLQVTNMLKNRNLAASISDVAWGELQRMLEYKAQWYGREIRTVGTFQRTTGVCPTTGYTTSERLPLHVRSWDCSGCGQTHDRDVAAAQVILQKSTAGKTGAGRRKPVRKARGGETTLCAVKASAFPARPPVKREGVSRAA